MESEREVQHPAALREILTHKGASSVDAIAGILAKIHANDAIEPFLDMVVEITGAERAFLLEHQVDDGWKCILARNLDQEDLHQPLD